MPSPRQRVRALQIKTELTEGIDPGTWASANVLPLTDMSGSKNFENQVLNEFGGSLDSGETIVGGSKPVLNASFALRGSGTAGTPLVPFSSLLKAGGFVETLRSATIPSAAAQVCTGGTANTVTFATSGTGAQWPTTTTDGQLGANAVIGEVVELAGDPVVPTTATIVGYNVTGAVITLTLSRRAVDCQAAGAVFTTTTTVRRVIGSKWVTGTPTPHPSVYAREFMDGARQDYAGSRPNVRATFRAGGFAQYDFAIAGQLVVPMVNDTIPSAPTFASPATGVNAWCTYTGGAIASLPLGVSEVSFDLGNQTDYPGNLNALQGFDPPVVGSRKVTGSVNPIMVLPGTRNLLTEVVGQTKGVLSFQWGPRTSYTAFTGNRQAVTFPNWKFTDHTIGADGSVLRETMPGEATSFDNGLVIFEF